MTRGGTLSVQVLNEFANVARRKLGFTVAEIIESLGAIRSTCDIVALDLTIHDEALALLARYDLSIYDATILSAALVHGCSTLYSEDFQSGQRFGPLAIRNPFAS